MPGFDGSGPNGQGPRTGWGLGRCGPTVTDQNAPQDNAVQAAPAYYGNRFVGPWGRGGRGPGRGRGRGMGRGMGGRWGGPRW
jgi:hypothetical protein